MLELSGMKRHVALARLKTGMYVTITVPPDLGSIRVCPRFVPAPPECKTGTNDNTGTKRMRVIFKGVEPSPAYKRIIKELLEWVLKEELCPNNHMGMYVTIKLSEFLVEGELGSVECIDSEDGYPSKFLITANAAQLNDDEFMDLLITIVHEAIHIKQWRMGEIRYNVDTGEYRFRDMMEYDCHYTPLKNQIWEWEAYGRSPLLADHFCDMSGYLQARWYRYLPS